MSKLSNIFKGEHKNFRVFVAFSTAVFVFIWIVGPGNTWIHWAKAGFEIKRQERQIKEYQQEILPCGAKIFGLTAGLPVNLEGLVGCNGKVFGLESFGFSAPYTVLDEKLGFTAQNVYNQVKAMF
mgnify:CR=1 FL=1